MAGITPRIPGYGLEMPCEASAVQSLSELLGSDLAQRTWACAAERAGVPRPIETLECLGAVAYELVRGDGPLIQVVGRSLLVRIDSYQALSLMNRKDRMNLDGIATSVGPIKDHARLTEIGELGPTELSNDPELQALAASAAAAFNLPIGVVSIVLDEFFVARSGVDGWVGDADGTPVEWSFCRNVVCSGSDFVVADARAHPVMKDSPLVLLEGLSCYAGTPMRSSKGNFLGSFCVQGKDVRSFSDEEMVLLRDYAARAVNVIENRRREVV